MAGKYLKLASVATIAALFFVGAPAYSGTIGFGEPGLVAGYGPDPYFPGTPKGTTPTSELINLGVLFSTDAYGVAYVSSQSYLPSGPATGNFLTVNTVPILDPSAVTLTVTFWASPSVPGYVSGSGLSVYVTDTESSPSPRVLVTTYDYYGTQLQQLPLTSLESTLAFSTGNVHRITFLDAGGDGHILDTLTYGDITAIPEPGTWLLLTTGLAGLAVALRRRKRTL